jgi:hypothetical protein
VFVAQRAVSLGPDCDRHANAGDLPGKDAGSLRKFLGKDQYGRLSVLADGGKFYRRQAAVEVDRDQTCNLAGAEDLNVLAAVPGEHRNALLLEQPLAALPISAFARRYIRVACSSNVNCLPSNNRAGRAPYSARPRLIKSPHVKAMNHATHKMTASAARTPARQTSCGDADEAPKSSARITWWPSMLAAAAAATRACSMPPTPGLMKIFTACPGGQYIAVENTPYWELFFLSVAG